MLNKPVNSSPYNTCITDSEYESVSCDIQGSNKIIGDYTVVKDIETMETVFEKYSLYDSPQSRIEHENIFTDSEKVYSGKDYMWNTFYWQEPKNAIAETTLTSKASKGEDTVSLVLTPNKKQMFATELYTSHYSKKTYKAAVNEDNLYWADNYITATNPSTGRLVGLSDYDELRGKLIAAVACDENNKVVYDDDNSFTVFAMAEITGYYFGYAFSYIYYSSSTFYETMKNNENNYVYCILEKEEFELAENSLIKIAGQTSGDEENKKRYYYLSKVEYSGADANCEVYPSFQADFSSGAKVEIYPSYEYWNISPDYYFRCKNSPTITIKSPMNDSESITDIKGNFGINFTPSENCAGLNYFQLYFYALDNADASYKLIEQSPKYFSMEDEYIFNGMLSVNPSKIYKSYKVVAICVDNDGDEWTSEIVFDADYSIVKNDCNLYFNKDEYIITADISPILSQYDNAKWEVYKHYNDFPIMDFVCENSTLFAKSIFKDYNIRNDVDYTYYLRVEYDGKLNEDSVSDGISGCEIVSLGTVYANFNGSCIMGLTKTYEGRYEIGKCFYLNYCFGENLEEMTQELSRDYIGTFGKYQTELKGSQNYISGSTKGLLGYESDGGYEEPSNMRDEWLSFINDDSLKLYKGFDGNTMLISISSSKVKPYYYEPYGLVNEVSLSYNQIGSLDNISIYELE